MGKKLIHPEEQKTITPAPGADCLICELRRRVGNPYHGQRLPSAIGGGKCIRMKGFCDRFKEKKSCAIA
jgi:hypothetical protein